METLDQARYGRRQGLTPPQSLRRALPRDRHSPLDGLEGDCIGNTVAETFFTTLEKDLLPPPQLRHLARRTDAVFDYIEAFYNLVRLHLTLDYLSPVEYEEMNERKRTPPNSLNRSEV